MRQDYRDGEGGGVRGREGRGGGGREEGKEEGEVGGVRGREKGGGGLMPYTSWVC